jgi:membrane protease YdiL (CAAX protease family)
MHWDFALILLFFAIAVPLLGRRRVQQLLVAPETTKSDRLKLYASTISFQWIAVAVILWRASARGVSGAELGLTVSNVALTAIVSFFLISLVVTNQLVSLKQLSTQPQAAQGRLQQVAMRIFPRDNAERAAYVALVTTVAICEEIIYRGFFQRVFESLAGDFVVAGVVGAAAMFAISHLYQGRRGVIATCIVGIIFSAIRAWTGSLIPSILAHFCADLIVGLMAPGKIQSAMIQVEQIE